MFEISKLKTMKLPELQEIAQGLKVPKFKTLKKIDLVYQILDLQAANPKAVSAVAPVLREATVKTENSSEAPRKKLIPRERNAKVAAQDKNAD
ncbi:MAG: transcription termination factor Rho, partial [Colwellia sp.]